MIQTRPALALTLALLLVAALARRAPAQLGAAVHVVTVDNRGCAPFNACTHLIGTPWYYYHPEVFRLATSSLNPGGVLEGVHYGHPVADTNTAFATLIGPAVGEIPSGAAFNLLAVREERSCVYAHDATAGNIVGNVTFLDRAPLNGHPNAFLLVQLYGYFGATNIGVYYDGSRSQWGIFKQDLSAMEVGRKFTIYDNTCDVGLGTKYILRCTGPLGESCDTGSVSIASGDPAAKILVTQRWNGVYNPHPIGVFYDPFDQVWKVFNEDLADMPVDALFNVAVIRVLLTDNFETGDTSAWSNFTPIAP